MSKPSQLLGECSQFLIREAELLDRWCLSEWLELLTTDIDYCIPVRTNTGFSVNAFYMKEDFSSLRTRVARLQSEFAWVENPPTRTRRIVANIRIANTNHANYAVQVLSNFVIYCYRDDAPAPIILTGERHDLLRHADKMWKLARRVILLDCNVLGLHALSIFL